MRREGKLFDKLISDENLLQAIYDVNSSHHWHKGHRPNRVTAWVEETTPERVKELREIITNGFEPKPPRTMQHWDPAARKMRTINEPAQWPDQYVHHALIQVLQPAMMRSMDPYCCGSIKGRGTRRAQTAIERWMNSDCKGTKYELCGDIYHFYDSLQPAVVMSRMRELIKDRRVLDLCERVTAGGILIGAYTSQWFANTVLQPLDRLIRQSGLCRHYARYMDNLTIFGPNKRKLHRLRLLIDDWLRTHGLKLKDDWQVFPTDKRLPDAVGYRYGRGYTLPRKHNLLRTKRAVARYRRKRAAGRKPARMAAGLLARLGQLARCSNRSIYRRLLRGERLAHELKALDRVRRKGERLEWSMYLAQRERLRSLKPRAIPTAG